MYIIQGTVSYTSILSWALVGERLLLQDVTTELGEHFKVPLLKMLFASCLVYIEGHSFTHTVLYS